MSLLRGTVVGLGAGALGTVAMDRYWQWVAPLLEDQTPPEHPTPDLHSVAPLGQLHAPGESSAAALGRLAYEAAEGVTPKDPKVTGRLSGGVHLGMGVLSGGLYGAVVRSGTPLKGLPYGAALWALVDEGLVPLLGLQDGPGGSTPRGHLNRLGAHLTYGLTLGVAALLLDRLLPGGED